MKKLFFIACIALLTCCKPNCGEKFEIDGNDCVAWNENKAGHYVGSLVCNNGNNSPFSDNVTVGNPPDQLTVGGLNAVMTSKNGFSIPLQVQGNISFSGSGTCDGSSLTFVLVSTQNNQTITCSASAARQ